MSLAQRTYSSRPREVFATILAAAPFFYAVIEHRALGRLWRGPQRRRTSEAVRDLESIWDVIDQHRARFWLMEMAIDWPDAIWEQHTWATSFNWVSDWHEPDPAFPCGFCGDERRLDEHRRFINELCTSQPGWSQAQSCLIEGD